MLQRWIHPEKDRYYIADLVQDLLGDWTLVLCWGGRESRRGRMRVIAVESKEAGLAQLQMIAKRRQQHGYRPDPQTADAISQAHPHLGGTERYPADD